jgi:formyltetrahydrofolate deformylase
MSAAPHHVLTLTCPSRAGIVAAVASHIFAHTGNIHESHQFDDPTSGSFFMRVRFELAEPERIAALRAGFATIVERYRMTLDLREAGERRKVLVLVSRFDHCLADLLYRWRIGELLMDIVGVVANHPRETYARLDLEDVPFHYLPVDRATKPEQEARLRALVAETGAELVVLARYMQVLSDTLAKELSGRCINIHHSFLPGFKGAKPYHQAHARGVKLIGATAHYVTPDLDEGPIIEQDVERVSHSDTPEVLVRKGRDIERRVLAEGIRLHLESRVLLNGSTAVVFRD